MPRKRAPVTQEEQGQPEEVALEITEFQRLLIATLRRLHSYEKTATYLTRKLGRQITPGSLRTETYRMRLNRLAIGAYLKEYEALRRSLGPGANYLSEKRTKADRNPRKQK